MKRLFIIIAIVCCSIHMKATPSIKSNQQKTADTIPPSLVRVQIVASNRLDVYFSESVDTFGVQNPLNYFVSNNIGNPIIATRDNTNKALVHLLFLNDITVRNNLQITATNIKDFSGNVSPSLSIFFVNYISMPYDIIIDEIMADPTPQIGLPNCEWIELKNTTLLPIDLFGLRIGKNNTLSGPINSFVLQPDSFVLICSTSSMTDLLPFARCLAVSNFPALYNTGDLIYLISPDKTTIHAVQYSDTWYKNEIKKQGGWSLEMIDINSPCLGYDNWSASKSSIGATPGKINSIDAINIYNVVPKILRTHVDDSTHVTLFFNEPVDSFLAASINNYFISDTSIHLIGSVVFAPLFNEARIVLSKPLTPKKIYTISASGILDCIGNEISRTNVVKMAIEEAADSLDIIINEILFNPKDNASDFVEMYNRSSHPINLKDIMIANKNNFGVVDNMVAVVSKDDVLYPGEFAVVTDNINAIQNNYFVKYPNRLYEVATMPSFNNDKGTVVILNRNGFIIDQVSYSENWHFALIDNKEGISLERISTESLSQQPANWHSASASCGYATPTYKNSQSSSTFILNDNIEVTPKIISPNNDGIDDFVSFEYSFAESGNVISAIIYDANGHLVRQLLKNSLAGIQGAFYWDGLDEYQKKLNPGIYIVFVQSFNAKGETNTCKKTVILK